MTLTKSNMIYFKNHYQTFNKILKSFYWVYRGTGRICPYRLM